MAADPMMAQYLAMMQMMGGQQAAAAAVPQQQAQALLMQQLMAQQQAAALQQQSAAQLGGSLTAAALLGGAQMPVQAASPAAMGAAMAGAMAGFPGQMAAVPQYDGGGGAFPGSIGNTAGGKGAGGKQLGSQLGTEVCSLHGKKRGVKNLQEDGRGGFSCAPGFECQVGVGGENGATLVCSVHGKKRGVSNMMDDGAGGMVCSPGFQCDSSSTAGGGQKKRRICEFWLKDTGCSRGAACTFAHGEGEVGTFSDPSAVDDFKFPEDWNCPGCGDLQFARNKECRKCGAPKPLEEGVDSAGEPTMACTTHGVQRGVMALTNDGAGGICCRPGDECKLAQAGFKGGGKGKDGGKGGPLLKRHMCKFYEQGTCTKGSSCSFAHGDHEIGQEVAGGGAWGGGKGGGNPWDNWGSNVSTETPYKTPAGGTSPGDMAKAMLAKAFSDRAAAVGGGGGAAAAAGGKGGGKWSDGDWTCASCGDHQFQRNTECRKCGAANPNGGGKGGRASPY